MDLSNNGQPTTRTKFTILALGSIPTVLSCSDISLTINVGPPAEMPIAQQTTKSQPWKAHWPPKKGPQEGLKASKGLGFKKGEMMVMDGNSASSGSASAKGWSERNVVTVHDVTN